MRREHRWQVSPAEARAIQSRLRQHVVVEPLRRAPRTVAGVDVGVRKGRSGGPVSRAAVVLLTLPELSRVDSATATRPTAFPYVPGLLAFREGPVVLDALERLTTPPDVMIFDAHGVAHPRRLGLATHLGVLLDAPTVGCAKSRLCGHYEEPAEERGSWTYLYDRSADGSESVIGAVVRTRHGVRPVFVSVGHRTDLDSAISLVLTCAPRYRLPETTRQAHRLASGRALSSTVSPTASEQSP